MLSFINFIMHAKCVFFEIFCSKMSLNDVLISASTEMPAVSHMSSSSIFDMGK